MGERLRLPTYMLAEYGSTRRYKAIKRRQLRILLFAFNAFRLGCAWFPNEHTQTVRQIGDALDRLHADLSEKEWGR